MKTKDKIQLARMAYLACRPVRRLIGMSDIAQVTRRGLNYELDLTEGIDFAIFLLGAFEPRTVSTLQQLIEPGYTVLDIGANIGAHTLHMAQSVGDSGRVLAFEPTTYAVNKLRRNIALNPELERRTKIYHAFLTAEDSASVPEEIYSSWPLVKSNNLHAEHGGQAQATTGAATFRLDTVLACENVDRVDLIKMDVDGYECAVLQGAGDTITAYRPIFLFEYSPYLLADHGGSVEAFFRPFEQAGYDFCDAETGDSLPVRILKDNQPVGVSRNLIAKPQ